MARKWTDEEVKAEIAEAVKIVKEDKERAQYLALHERFGSKDDPGKPQPKDGDPTPPPQKDGDPDPTPAKRKSLWWGDALGDGDE